jgi:hypothetical protein
VFGLGRRHRLTLSLVGGISVFDEHGQSAATAMLKAGYGWANFFQSRSDFVHALRNDPLASCEVAQVEH